LIVVVGRGRPRLYRQAKSRRLIRCGENRGWCFALGFHKEFQNLPKEGRHND
jgi:hypothetical protein